MKKVIIEVQTEIESESNRINIILENQNNVNNNETEKRGRKRIKDETQWAQSVRTQKDIMERTISTRVERK